MTRLPLLAAILAVLFARGSALHACDEDFHWDAVSVSGSARKAIAHDPEVRSVHLQTPPEARKLAEKFDEEARDLRAAADEKLNALRARTVRRLKPLQDKYTREAKLDEALAIREEIRRIQDIRPDPGILRAGPGSVGKSYFFEVVGSTVGAVWGTEAYTTDSHLAAAAVHAGALKPGEKGIVKATVLPGRPSYEPSTKNGVASQGWGEWGVSFRVEKYPL